MLFIKIKEWFQRCISIILYIVLGLIILPTVSIANNDDLSMDQLADLDLFALSNIKVTTVSRSAEKLSSTSAAVYVITNEDIRRSGVTNIPEALRMAPGVQVAQLDANKWAISIRGFNSLFADKLLVMIDGRTVYNPLFSGVYWDVQDVLLEDVDRIEVVRGPGGTLWGANAVNGVINIITKNAEDTQGGLIALGGGSEESGSSSIRYGGRLGANSHYRVYTKYFDRNDFVDVKGQDTHDEWDMFQSGFRMDWNFAEDDSLIIQGDYYDGTAGQNVSVTIPTVIGATFFPDEVDISGGNFMTRWEHRFPSDSDIALQLYYDRTERRSTTNEENRDTLDLDFQYRVNAIEQHNIIWGLGYRQSSKVSKGSFTITFNPLRRNTELFSGFIHDDVELIKDRLHLIVGSKFEHNDFSGFEYQPSLRLKWTPDERRTIWGAVSRAVQTPSEGTSDLRINAAMVPVSPPPPVILAPVNLTGNKDLDSQTAMAYEIGFRSELSDRISLDFSFFYNEYDDIINIELVPGGMAVIFDNILNGETYGGEVLARFKITNRWLLTAGYTGLQMQLHPNSSTLNQSIDESMERVNPHNQVHLRSIHQLPHNFEFDTMVYFVDNIDVSPPLMSTIHIASYLRLDIRLGWRPKANLEFSISAQNILDDQHVEFVDSSSSVQGSKIERSIHAKITWKF